MKKNKLLILFLSGFCVLQSCLHEDNDIFGKSAAQRLNEAQILYGNILTSATNGWRLEYMVGNTDATRRGAFNFLLKFEDGKVTASVDALALSDIDPTIDPYTKITSYYKLDQDMSITLSFDTYNSFLHYYHEQHGSYTTYMGDFEFTIMEASDDLIILRGKKYGNIMEMHKIPDNLTWETYLADVNNIIDVCGIYSNFEIKQNGETIASGSTNANYRYTFSTTDGDKELASNALFTQTGIKFIDALDINGTEVQNFEWNDTDKLYVCTDVSDITIVPIIAPSFLYYEEYIGTYLMTYSGTLSKTVTIEQKIRGRSFVVKNMMDFDVELSYNKSTGSLSIVNQDIGISADNYTVSMVAWDSTAGYINYNLGYGMVSSLNMVSLESGIIRFSFVDNGVWTTYSVTGFVLYRFSSVLGGHTTATRIGTYTGENRFYNITMTKQ